jgi:adenylate cyclase
MISRSRRYALEAGAFYAILLIVVAIYAVAENGPASLAPTAIAVVLGGFVISVAAGWLVGSKQDEPPVDGGEPRNERVSLPALPPLSDTARSSVVVLPLENLSADDEDEFLAQGFSSEINRALSGLSDLRIVSQLQSLRFAHADLRQMRNELEVRYVLSGSVQRSGDRIRVIVLLSDTSDESEVWSASYERSVDDLFAVQREVAEAVAAQTDSSFLVATSAETSNMEPKDLSAWGLTYKAINFWLSSYDRAGSDEATSTIAQAIELEPNYAFAHAISAFLFNQRVMNAFCDDPNAEQAVAMRQVEHALQLASRDPSVLEYAGLVLFNNGSQSRAVGVLRRLLNISPFNLIAWGYLGNAYAWGGTDEEALESVSILERLPKIAPNHPSMPFWNYFLATAYQRVGDLEQARDSARASVTTFPGFCLGWFSLGNVLGRMGDVAGAVTAEESAKTANPAFSFQYFYEYVRVRDEEWTDIEPQLVGLRLAGLIKDNV